MAPHDDRMSLTDHLEELRQRLIKSIIIIAVATALCYVFSDQILAFLKAPAGDLIEKFVAFSPMDGFIIKMKVALYAGLVISCPFWAWQLIQFIAPGLTPSERRFLIPATLATAGLFLLGSFAGYLSLGTTMKVLIGMFGTQIEYLPTAGSYVQLVIFLLLAWGLAFETPVVVVALVYVGLLEPATLRKHRRIAYFVMFVFAEIVTPVADPIVAPLIIMIPMVALFEISILISDRIFARRRSSELSTTGSGR
ncbi:MAG: twin-arginine translocase subunit TatC [Anaerolineae bacterium]